MYWYMKNTVYMTDIFVKSWTPVDTILCRRTWSALHHAIAFLFESNKSSPT